MIKTTSALAARKHFGRLLEEAYYRGDNIIIERAGKPMAVIVSVDDFETLKRQKGAEAAQEARGVLGEAQKRGRQIAQKRGWQSEAEVEEEVNRIIQEIRYGKKS